MPEGQAPPGGSWGKRPPRERPRPAGGAALGRHQARPLETEKSPSALSFHWKEELLLRRQLGLLDAMKKREASARLSEQKAFYRRCHARLRSDRDPVQLGCPTRWSCPSGPSDESGAAVQAILRGRLGSAGAGTRRRGQEAPRHPAPAGGGQPGGHGARAASGGGAEAQGPWWALAAEAQGRPEPAAQPSEPPGQTAPRAQEAGRQPGGKLLLYVMHGSGTPSRPRGKGRGPERVPAAPAQPTPVPTAPPRDGAPRDPAPLSDLLTIKTVR